MIPIKDQIQDRLSKRAVSLGTQHRLIGQDAISRTSYYDWMSGGACPSIATLERVVDAMGCELRLVKKRRGL